MDGSRDALADPRADRTSGRGFMVPSAFPPPRTMRRTGKLLEDDGNENPCFGCGPRNRRGLRLRFFDDGRAVRSELAPRPEFEGWPTNWNLGLALTAAIETLGWALWERQGPSRISGPLKVEGLGRLQLALPLRFEARRVRRGRTAQIVSSVRQRGRLVLRVSAPVARMTPADAARCLRTYSGIPRSMRPAFESLAAQDRTLRPRRLMHRRALPVHAR